MELMESKICLDTNVLISFVRNKKETVDFIKENEQTSILATTYVNLFELYYGAYKSNKIREIIAIELLKQRLIILNLDDPVVRKAGEIAAILEKRGETIDFRDLLIGSIAMMNEFSIKTENIKHFVRVPG